MIKYEGNIVQFGFGAVGKSFFEKVKKEISFNENNYYVVTANKEEYDAYINLGGMVTNFILVEVTKDNFKLVFEKYLKKGDLLIDFADTVGTKDICEWCAENNIMYINTGEADWPENWYSIFKENIKKREMQQKYSNSKNINLYPIVLQHGNNPGLVSHFVKSGLEYIVKTQHKNNKYFKELIKQHKFNELAQKLELKMIHVNDIDLQKIEEKENILYNTWCIDSFFFEMLSESTLDIGTHEQIDYEEKCNLIDKTKGFLELKKLAVDTQCHTYYPNGTFTGFLIPHEETITIAQSLEVEENGKIVYRPSVMFIYSPCEVAKEYFKTAKINDYAQQLQELIEYKNEYGETIVRGYKYPNNYEIVYKEKIKSGTEYVGVLLMGKNFKPVWVGNRIEESFLYKHKKDSYWQTPTITPVAMSALAAVCWMLKNKEKGGVYFPDDIKDYHFILKIAEKYISKTIYKTFEKQTLVEALNIDFSNIQAKDFFAF